jgi:hypothetical protein
MAHARQEGSGSRCHTDHGGGLVSDESLDRPWPDDSERPHDHPRPPLTGPDPHGPDPHGPDPHGAEPHDDDLAEPPPLDRVAKSLAGALADGFLTGPWQRDALLDAGGHVLGRRQAWLRPVVTAVLKAYRDAPTDRPRELAGYLLALPAFGAGVQAAPASKVRRPAAATPGFGAAVRSPASPHRPVARIAVPTSTVRQRWPLPRLDHLGHLADFLDLDPEQLDWFADRRGLERRARDERLRHYRYAWVPTRSGGLRLLEAPKHRLKTLQRRLLAEIVGLVPTHDAAHGFRPGRSVASFAAPHAGRRTVVRLDLEGFFATVSAARIYGIFRTAGYPEPVAHTLTGLVTVATPVRVLASAPRPGYDTALPTAVADADQAVRASAHRRLLRRLATPHLPQGAPTSPALANLCAYRLDQRLAGLAGQLGARYTRYADDLAFSGDLPVAALVRLVGAIAADEGFRVNEGKTTVRGRGDRQLLGGLVVNAAPAVPRDSYDQLKAILHNAARTGPAAQNRAGHPDFRAHLLGRIAWVAQTHPARGARLRAAFERIGW